MGAAADDMEAEYIRSICDREVVSGDNLLASVMSVPVHLSWRRSGGRGIYYLA